MNQLISKEKFNADEIRAMAEGAAAEGKGRDANPFCFYDEHPQNQIWDDAYCAAYDAPVDEMMSV